MKTKKIISSLVVLGMAFILLGCVSTPAAPVEIELSPADATIHTERVLPQLQVEEPKGNLGYWHNTEEYVTWDVEIPQAGDYMISMTYAAWGENAGSSFMMEIGGKELTGIFASTSEANDGYFAWKEMEVGKVTLEAGAQVLTMKVTKIVKEAAGNIKGLKIAPAK
jgi:hypothetical protein